MSSHAGVGRRERRAALNAAESLFAQRLPRLSFERVRGGGVVANGPIEMHRPDGTIDPIEVRVVFEADFPRAPPIAYDVAGRWEPDDDRHIPADGSFCLYLREMDEPNIAAPRGLDFWILDLVVFLQQQLVYESTGRARFPGPEWTHGRSAYAQHALEILGELPTDARPNVWIAAVAGVTDRNGACPCGSGNKAKRCHLDLVAELRRVALRSHLVEMSIADLEALRDG